MKPKAKFVPKEREIPCEQCFGTGYGIADGLPRYKALQRNCKVCKGSGFIKDKTYTLIATNKKGKKIAFQVDGLK